MAEGANANVTYGVTCSGKNGQASVHAAGIFEVDSKTGYVESARLRVIAFRVPGVHEQLLHPSSDEAGVEAGIPHVLHLFGYVTNSQGEPKLMRASINRKTKELSLNFRETEETLVTATCR